MKDDTSSEFKKYVNSKTHQTNVSILKETVHMCFEQIYQFCKIDISCYGERNNYIPMVLRVYKPHGQRN